MTTVTITTLPNGDIKETRTNPGCAPTVYINGVRQEPPLTTKWEPWYAWRPVRVNGKWYWLTTVYRKFLLSPGGGFHAYGDSFDILKDTR